MRKQYKQIAIVIALIGTTLFFQNCGSSVDVEDYKDVSSTGTPSPTPSPMPKTAAPIITGTSQPGNVEAGGQANFSVSATGTSLSYQWYKDGVSGPLAGATGATYSLSNVGDGNNGNYYVVVSNPGGSVTSAKLNLNVTHTPPPPPPPPAPVAPVITFLTSSYQIPWAEYGNPPARTLSVSASGDGLSYQWTASYTDGNGIAQNVVISNGPTAQAVVTTACWYSEYGGGCFMYEAPATYTVIVSSSNGLATSASLTSTYPQ